ncbi:MAG TPA: hypothetical protein PLE26_01620 [Candidatus Paceibacterota bacterium]|jgi:hypothetical protein|nr:hypothetical protein [Candidatus Paceibacterota bacterium]HQB57154.1 hypothetical protein [Candidatus Paceibacterota bacterium]
MEKAGKEGVEIMKANGFATIFLAVILISLYGLDWLWPITDFFSKIFSQLFNGIFSIGWKGFLFIVGLYLLFKPKKEKKK